MKQIMSISKVDVSKFAILNRKQIALLHLYSRQLQANDVKR